MAIIVTGESGIPLKDIIAKLGNKSYCSITCRCKWTENGEEYDELFGACSYNNKTQTLTPLDGDSYSLNDLYEEYEESYDMDGNNYLTVWESGRVE